MLRLHIVLFVFSVQILKPVFKASHEPFQAHVFEVWSEGWIYAGRHDAMNWLLFNLIFFSFLFSKKKKFGHH